MNVEQIVAGEQDFPGTLRHLRTVAWPVQCTDVPANLYLRATVVAHADFGDLPDPGNDWQDVFVQLPISMFEPDDILVDMCPSFLVGGIERQETPIGSTDNWGLALDQAPAKAPVVPPPLGVDSWWQGRDDPRLLVVTFRIRNRGQSQMPDVSLAFDTLVFRKSVHGFDGPDWHASRFTRFEQPSPVRIAGL